MTLDEIFEHDDEFRSALLDRLRQDCEYYFGYGNRDDKALWAGNPGLQIEYMKAIYVSLRNCYKLEWLRWKDILNFEKKMLAK